MAARVLAAPRWQLIQTLLLIVAAAAAPVANAAAPVLDQDDLGQWWEQDGAVEMAWELSASTTVTKHQYRYTIWNRAEIPTSWTQDWTDIPLTDTRCTVVTNPGLPSATTTPTATGAACATTGSDAAKGYEYWTTVRGLANGVRYRFELRAVNSDGNSDAIYVDIALPADPDGIVTIPDAEFDGRVRARIQGGRGPGLGAGEPITQLHMSRIQWLHERGGARNVDNRIRSLDGIEYAVNIERLFIDFHQVLDVQRLQELYQLKVFSFAGSLLSDVSPLQNLTNLEELLLNRGLTYPPEGVCTGTAAGPEHGRAVWPPSASCPAGQVDDVVVRDLSSLSRLTKLRRLWLCDQRVNPAHLTTFVNMEAMSYCRNDLSDISGMRNLAKMETLYLFENRIEDVSPLAGMTELQFLQLHDNAIRDVSSLSGLTKLRHVYLSDNPLDAGSCSTGGHDTRAACEDASGTWTTHVVSTLTPLVTGSCSVAGQTTEAGCLGMSGTWTAGALKLIDLRGETQLSDADVTALSTLAGVTVLHDADIRPAAPQGLTATTTARTATLTWTDPSNAVIASYQYRHRQGTGAWSDWQMTTEHESSFHTWNRGPADLTTLTLSGLPGGATEVELRAMVASAYNTARTRNSDGTTFTGVKTHQTAVAAAAVGAGRWEVGRVLTPGAATSTMVEFPVTASIASTAPTALTETNLDGATVVVDLSGTTFGASLAASSFQATTTISGVTIASASRTSDTRATLTLGFDDTNFDLQSTLAVRVLAAALGSASDLETQTVAVAPTLGVVLGGPTGIGTGMLALQEDPGGSMANLEAYNVTLAGQPTGAVTVTPTSSNADVELYAFTPPLSFDGTNWNVGQSVGIRALQDLDAIDDIAVISHAVTGISGLTAGPRLTVTVTDDETQGLTLAATTLTGSGVTEGGSAVTYTARLASAPTGPVRVQITGGAGAVSVDTDTAAGLQNTLLFNATNYSTPQTVTVAALDDDDGESESVTLTHAVFGADYQDLDDVALAFTVTDDDIPGGTLSTNNLTLQENGSRQYTLVLDTEPVGGPVSVAVASSATAVATVEPATLTFTAQNWNVPQTVTVAGVDDADSNAAGSNVTHTPTGADYGSVTIGSVAVTVQDDEAAGLDVSPTSLTVAEGATATYAVRLHTAPTGAVTVTVGGATAKLTADTDTGTTGDQTTLSFDATNWNTAQTVTVTAVADDDGADETATLINTASGAGAYNSLSNSPGVAVQVRDDETAGVVVSPTSLTIDEGGTATYTVRLSAPPATGSATVTIAATGAVGATVDTSTLTFSGTTWNTAQTVTVTAVADHARAMDGRATLVHTVANYAVTAGPDLPVQVRNTTMDYDADADGLIEIANLAQLNAVRWDLDGDGMATSTATMAFAAAFPNPRGGTACPTTITSVACTGYELATDLDFDTNGNGRTWTETGGTLAGDDGDEYDNSGMGWEPIGTDAERFAAVFRGNGRTIDNLFVNRDGSGVGLFGATASTARIEFVGVRDARVGGSSVVGILVGEARGDVVACYVSGQAGSPTASVVGGLVGRLRGDVAASYSSAAVEGSEQIGGLIGAAVGGSGQTRTVSGSYAVGRTSAAAADAPWVGGLIGRASPALPESAVTAPDSYYDSGATGQAQSARGEAKDTAALQSPTRYAGIYASWNMDLDGDFDMDDPWHFGTSSQYPVLKLGGFDPATQLPRAPSVPDPADPADPTVPLDPLGNRAPVVLQAFADATLEGNETLSLDLGGAFRDPDADELTYAARSSDPGVASTAVRDGALFVVARSFGFARVTVTATDSGGLSATQSFGVRVGIVVSFAGDASAAEGGAVRLELVASPAAQRRLEVAYSVAPGSDPSSAADRSDHDGGDGGTVVFAAGAERAGIEIGVLDDDAVEPLRERFVLTLAPPAADAGYGLGERPSAVVTIEEGVCDRSDAVRDALRGRMACEAVADLSSRTSLRLAELGLARLRVEDLLGLAQLRLLDVSRNGLSEWPAGLLAALPNLHTLRLGGNRLGALPESLGTHAVLTELDLSGNALPALPGGAFRGLGALRRLLLDGNLLEELPAGLFEGVGQLEELQLQDNPGAPFALAMELVRTDAQPWAPGPASVSARVAEGAPFALQAALEASPDVLPDGAALSVPAGAAQGPPATVAEAGAMPVTVRLAAAPAAPEDECGEFEQRPCFQGIAAEAGAPLVLFKRPPMAAPFDDQELEAEGDALRLDLAERFEAAADEALTFKAESSDESVVRVRLRDGMLYVEALDEGMATVTVVATDEDGLTGRLRFAVRATEQLRSGVWRGWRLILLQQSRAGDP